MVGSGTTIAKPKIAAASVVVRGYEIGIHSMLNYNTGAWINRRGKIGMPIPENKLQATATPVHLHSLSPETSLFDPRPCLPIFFSHSRLSLASSQHRNLNNEIFPYIDATPTQPRKYSERTASSGQAMCLVRNKIFVTFSLLDLRLEFQEDTSQLYLE